MRYTKDQDPGIVLENIEVQLGKIVDEVFRTSVSASSTFLTKRGCDQINHFRVPKNLTDCIRLAILSWYFPEDVGILLRLDLEEKAKHPDFVVLEFLLESKALMLLFLKETNLWTTREFFGNVLNRKQIDQLRRFLRPKRRSSGSVRRPIRKRGYRDKGSLKPPHKFDGTGIDCTQEHNRIESLREARSSTSQLIRGLLD